MSNIRQKKGAHGSFARYGIDARAIFHSIIGQNMRDGQEVVVVAHSNNNPQEHCTGYKIVFADGYDFWALAAELSPVP